MSVPHHNNISQAEYDAARVYILNHVKRHSRYVNGRILGNPYVYYKELAHLLGFTIDSEHDGDRLGWVAGEASELEYPVHHVLIGSLVVSVDYMRPGPGFYWLAQQKGLFIIPGKKPDPDGKPELNFWARHVEEVVKYYGGH